MQLTVERLRLPGLIGLLLIGMALGPGGANVLPREPMLDLLGSIGLIYVITDTLALVLLAVVIQILREHVGFVGRMLFIPFFFVSTGTLLEISVFTESVRVWGIAAMLLGMVAAGKASATWAVGSRFLYPWRDRLLLFSLTIPQAAATLAVTITARDAGVFDDIVVDAVIVLIFITCLVGPLLTQRVGLQLSRPDSIDG